MAPNLYKWETIEVSTGVHRQVVTIGGTADGAGTVTLGAMKDAGPSWTTVHGIGGTPYTAVAGTAATAVSGSPTSGLKLVVTDLAISVDTAMTLTFKEETSGAVVAGPWFFSAANGVTQFTPRGKLKLATADKRLMYTSSGTAGTVSIDAYYYSES